MKINVLYLGKIDCKRDDLVQDKDENMMIQSPINAILIRHPELGNILYDTGNSPYYNSEYPASVLQTYPVTEFISVEEALHSHGLGVDDIDKIILSHLHFDHAGGLRYFMGTKAFQNVIVSEDELKGAFLSVMAGQGGAYVKSLFDLDGIRFVPYQKELQLAKDIRLFSQKSHTAGCTGMVLDTEQQGAIIVTSDTVYTADSYQNELPPGGSINATTEEFFANLKMIKKMQAQLDAELIYGHDFEQIMKLSKCTLI